MASIYSFNNWEHLTSMSKNQITPVSHRLEMKASWMHVKTKAQRDTVEKHLFVALWKHTLHQDTDGKQSLIGASSPKQIGVTM